ncbi:DUF7523 family protein [Halopiger goleimassiliensis]|uniref:DUF7523 family protein n=1 Tax=Halopiger goleimassiliensis TaxID=1293048 RepID=UPI000A510E04|nr:hypothetical protein [Halopiger goleimassiliensis]
MSLAAETRRAVDERPFLRTALRADVVNYTAAARYLDVEGETDAIATALRRYAEELDDYETEPRTVRVRMESGFGRIDPADGENEEPPLLVVGDAAFGPTGGDRTAIVATGSVDPTALATTIRRLGVEGIDPIVAGVGDETLVVIVDRLEGANAVRTVEGALERTPVRTDRER